jgi:copper chaperone
MRAARLRYGDMTQLTFDPTEIHTTTLHVAGMSCGGCARHVSTALENITGVAHADVSQRTNESRVEHVAAIVDAAALVAAVRDAGYPAHATGTVTEVDREPTPVDPAARGRCACGGAASGTRPWWSTVTPIVG